MFEQNPALSPGNANYTTHLWEILIMLLIAALLGFLIAYFWQQKRIDDLEAELDELSELENPSHSFTEKDKKHKKHKKKKEKKTNKVKPEAISPEAAVVIKTFDAKTASEIMGKKVKENDLKVIEGIGSKISDLFMAAGINSWQALADLSIAECERILESGGKDFKMHDPETWPEQAALAVKGEWVQLKELQDELDGGKRQA
jgi:predicted flap endonuclease-1-like 5' DNA nuclease